MQLWPLFFFINLACLWIERAQITPFSEFQFQISFLNFWCCELNWHSLCLMVAFMNTVDRKFDLSQGQAIFFFFGQFKKYCCFKQVMATKNHRLIQHQQILPPAPSVNSGAQPSSPYYTGNNSSGGVNNSIPPPPHAIKDYLYGTPPYSSTTHLNTSPHPRSSSPHRWQHNSADNPGMLSIVTNSPKHHQLMEGATSKMSPDVNLARGLFNGYSLTPPHGSHMREHSPEFTHHPSPHPPQLTHLHGQHLSLADRSFSQHSDPGTYGSRRDRSFESHSPSSLHLNDSPQHMVTEYGDCSPHHVVTPPQQNTPVNSRKSAALHANAHVGSTLVGMKLDVSNIFFGKVRCKPTQPVLIHETGLKIPVVHKDKGLCHCNVVLLIKFVKTSFLNSYFHENSSFLECPVFTMKKMWIKLISCNCNVYI